MRRKRLFLEDATAYRRMPFYKTACSQLFEPNDMGATDEEVELALLSLGKFNRRRVCAAILASLTFWSIACYGSLAYAFTAEMLPHHCKVPDGANISSYIPTKAKFGNWALTECEKYASNSSNTTEACGADGWQYTNPGGEVTIVSQWDLVCERNYLAELAQTIYFAGTMLGYLICGPLSDRFGRKIVFLGSSMLAIVFGVVMAFAPNITIYSVMKFILGTLSETSSFAGFVLVNEMFPSTTRPAVGLATQLLWVVSWTLMTLFAFLFRTYWHLLLVLYSPLVLSAGLVWFVPESVPWLFANNRHKDALDILRKDGGDKTALDRLEQIFVLGRKDNGAYQDLQSGKPATNDDAEMLNEVEPLDQTDNTPIADHRVQNRRKQNNTDTAYTFCDLFRNRVLVVNTVIASYSWFAISMIYLALSFTSVKLGGNKYTNFLLSGLVEVPAYILAAFIANRFGRKRPLIISVICCGIFTLATPFIPESSVKGISLVPLIITVSMIAKFFITFADGITYVYTNELYPTNLRNAGFGFAAFLSSPADMLTPFVIYLEKVRPWIPHVVCGVLAITAAPLVFFLPETHKRPLAATIEDVEDMSIFAKKKRAPNNCKPVKT